MSSRPTRSASSSGRPRASETAALPAARVAPQPEASKPASATRSSSTATETRTRSPQAAPPAAPVAAPFGRWPRPTGAFRCSANPPTRASVASLVTGEGVVHGLADLGPVRVADQRARPVPAVDDDDGRRLEHLDTADGVAEERDLPHRGRDDEHSAAVRGHVGELRTHAPVIRGLLVP